MFSRIMRAAALAALALAAACSSRPADSAWCAASDPQATCHVAFYDCLIDAEVSRAGETYHLVFSGSRVAEAVDVDDGLAILIRGAAARSEDSLATWHVTDDEAMISVSLEARHAGGEYLVDLRGENFFVHPAASCL